MNVGNRQKLQTAVKTLTLPVTATIINDTTQYTSLKW